MKRPKILVTNDDGWGTPGISALKSIASQFGDAYVLAPRDPHSYAGHRVTTDAELELTETAPDEFHLTGTPADCVRVALTLLWPDLDWVLSGINRGGNLGADIFTSGTVAAAREAALLGRPAIAISQYMRKGVNLDWRCSQEMALPVLRDLIAEPQTAKTYWNVNLPHLDSLADLQVMRCNPDTQPLDVRYRRENQRLVFAGTYRDRPRTEGHDVDYCFAGNVTVSLLHL